jgi:hypothetical protein
VVPGDVQDHAAPLGAEALGRPPGTKDRTPQVHSEDAIELVDVRQASAFACEDVGSGVIHPNVDTAQAREGLLHEALDVRFPGDVDVDEKGLTARLPDLLR